MRGNKSNLIKNLMSDAERNERGWLKTSHSLINAQVSNLTAEELRVQLNLLSKPENWIVNQNELMLSSGLTKNRLNKAINGLKEKRYLKINRSSSTGRYSYIYTVYEQPFSISDDEDIENITKECSNQELQTNSSSSMNENQGMDNKLYINNNKKNLKTNTNKKEEEKKNRKKSEISLSSTKDKLCSIGINPDNVLQPYESLKKVERENYLKDINIICSLEDCDKSLTEALLGYLNCHAENKYIFTPSSLNVVLEELVNSGLSSLDKITKVKKATVGRWKQIIYKDKKQTPQPTSQVSVPLVSDDDKIIKISGKYFNKKEKNND